MEHGSDSAGPAAIGDGLESAAGRTPLTGGAGVGEWQAVLSIDKRELDLWIRGLREHLGRPGHKCTDRLVEQTLSSIKSHGVPLSSSTAVEATVT